MAGQAKAVLPPQDLIQWKTLDMTKSPDSPPNTWQKHCSRTRNAAEVLRLQPVSNPCRKHLVSLLSSTCKCSTNHSCCSRGLMPFRSTMDCSKRKEKGINASVTGLLYSDPITNSVWGHFFFFTSHFRTLFDTKAEHRNKQTESN